MLLPKNVKFKYRTGSFCWTYSWCQSDYDRDKNRGVFLSCETDFLLALDNFHTAIKFHFVIVFREARSH